MGTVSNGKHEKITVFSFPSKMEKWKNYGFSLPSKRGENGNFSRFFLPSIMEKWKIFTVFSVFPYRKKNANFPVFSSKEEETVPPYGGNSVFFLQAGHGKKDAGREGLRPPSRADLFPDSVTKDFSIFPKQTNV